MRTDKAGRRRWETLEGKAIERKTEVMFKIAKKKKKKKKKIAWKTQQLNTPLSISVSIGRDRNEAAAPTYTATCLISLYLNRFFDLPRRETDISSAGSDLM
jgi:hypothetical protein